MIRIIEKAGRLQRLYLFNPQEKDIDEEFDRVCKDVFGGTSADILDREFNEFPEISESDAISFAQENGFDLTSDGQLIKYWEYFIPMIQAHAAGILPGGKNYTGLRRLELEAEIMQYDNAVSAGRIFGSISRFNYERGFGFISTASHDEEIFVHISKIQQNKPCDIKIGSVITFQLADENGRPVATDVQIFKSDTLNQNLP